MNDFGFDTATATAIEVELANSARGEDVGSAAAGTSC